MKNRWHRRNIKKTKKADKARESLVVKMNERYSEFPTLDAYRRKDIISCLLLGIQDSVRNEGESGREERRQRERESGRELIERIGIR